MPSARSAACHSANQFLSACSCAACFCCSRCCSDAAASCCCEFGGFGGFGGKGGQGFHGGEGGDPMVAVAVVPKVRGVASSRHPSRTTCGLVISHSEPTRTVSLKFLRR